MKSSMADLTSATEEVYKNALLTSSGAAETVNSNIASGLVEDCVVINVDQALSLRIIRSNLR
jgi:hypothetical protein